MSMLPLGAAAQVIRLGPELPANSFILGDQIRPAVAADDDGDFVVVWQSYGQDGSGFGVFAQRFSSAGVATGSELQVNSRVFGWQHFPAVAADVDGDFVIAWMSDIIESGSFGSGIFGQRFSSAGNPLATEFQVSSYTTSYEVVPAIAADADGAFVVVWQSFPLDGSSYRIAARRFSREGAPMADEFQVNSSTTGAHRYPSVAMDAEGDFVVAWLGHGGIFARRFSSAGVSMASELQVNTHTTTSYGVPAVASSAAGDFVVAWRLLHSSHDVFTRRFSSAGVALASELQVSSHTMRFISAAPALAVNDDGGFVVAWESWTQDGAGHGVFGRRFSSAGAPVDGEFYVNAYTVNDQILPAAAAGAEGDFVVVWSSFLQDWSGWGVVGQRFTVPTTTPTSTPTTTTTATPAPTSTITSTALPDELYEIPTLSSRAMTVLGLLLLAASLVYLQRRRTIGQR